ncbi:hypothetical protein [Noviherbaspirillum sedimenti]|uniref:EthD domain-containing protein n=1 Tax=Noviherbaspirillum sedimenti TaxID=2320865 RepID=A0A3A3GIB6_9BURK|nr:hypothetical protein [Noviherbaspirillum sedimenti]RJG00650.1 hypothetical protein D3878_02845 [Noviherbaspirillum sedimenti]
MSSLLTVLINPTPGKEADFDSWYTHVHIRDVMRFAGSIRVQRLVAAEQQIEPPSHKYFTLYDTFDPALLSLEHKEAMGTPRMVVTNAHDKENVINGYYNPVSFRSNDPELLMPDTQPLILEQLRIHQNEATAFERWYSDIRLPAIMATAGHLTGSLLRFAQHGQMFAFEPQFSHMAIYRVSDLDTARASWRAQNAESDTPYVKRRAVSCYVPMMPYLTRDAVARASAEEQAVEETARAHASRSSATTEQLGVKWR